MAVAPDGNYVVVHQDSREASTTTPGYIDLYALKLNAATGQTIWNTSLNAVVAGRTIQNYGLEPGLERRASGYFMFISGAMILLDEDGSNPSLRSSTTRSWHPTLYSPTTQTTVVLSNRELCKLDNQGNVVLIGNTTSIQYGYASGYFSWLAEDSQNSIIAIKATSYVSGPGGVSSRQISVQRIDKNLKVMNTNEIRIAASPQFDIIIAPTGEYIAAGAISPLNTLALVSIPAYAVLSTAKSAPVVGSLVLYPNPTTANVTVTLPTAVAAGQVRLYDMLGRPQGTIQQITGLSATLEMPRLSAGIYVVRFTSPDGRAWTNRLTVQ